MTSSVRIIGGIYRGKKIIFPESNTELRPTPNRVRETLFNWLMDEIRERRCLDAFAGSGALGFEALSRGAKRVVLLERCPKVHTYLKKFSAALANSDLFVLRQEAQHYLEKSQECFDLVFLDPPFHQNLLPVCLQQLSERNILVPGGLVYIESPKPYAPDEQLWRLRKAKRAGNVNYALYEKRVMS